MYHSSLHSDRGQHRKDESFAWILIVAIWAITIYSFYLLWAKMNTGI